MEGFLHAVSSVTIILLLTATGYFCARMGWMSPQAKRFISKFTMSALSSSWVCRSCAGQAKAAALIGGWSKSF